MSNPDASSNKSLPREDIERQVDKLIRKNAGNKSNISNYQVYENLKGKYNNDEMVETIMKKYSDKMKRVRKLASKIKQRLFEKHPHLSQKEYIDKVSSYKEKYGFDDAEAQAIINDIINKPVNITNERDDAGFNKMSKALGFVPISYNLSGRLNPDKDDVESLQEILKLDSISKDLHMQVMLQHLFYDNSKLNSQVITNANQDKHKANIYSFVHPVVVALFLPKINLLDDQMIIASISKIISQKQNGLELQTQPEYELYWQIATDPAETACVTKNNKPFYDLYTRFIVQTKLWESILNLRQGKCYLPELSSLSTFIAAIDNCKASIFDSADLAFVKDEGTILRKLFAAFSFRPIVVLTLPAAVGITTGLLNMGVNGIASPFTSQRAMTSGHITTLPIWTIRPPHNVNSSVSVKDNIQSSQQQFYIHHGRIVVKEQQLIFVRGIFSVYIHRRSTPINVTKFTSPFQFASLPNTLGTFEKLHNFDITEYDGNTIANIAPIIAPLKDFKLKSVVCVKTMPYTDKNVYYNAGNVGTTNSDVIISSTTIVFNDVETYKYDPLDPDTSYGNLITPFKTINDPNIVYPEIKTHATLLIYVHNDQLPTATATAPPPTAPPAPGPGLTPTLSTPTPPAKAPTSTAVPDEIEGIGGKSIK